MITKLTEEQEAQIPIFIQKWVDKASGETDREKATEAVTRMYEAMGEEKPIVIFGESPMSTAYMSAMFFELIKTDEFKKEELHSQLSSQLYSQLSSQLDRQLHSQLSNQLDRQLRSQLRSQLYSQLHSQIYRQLDRQLHSQLSNQLDRQLRSQLRSQLSSQLSSQLRSQLSSQLSSQLYSQLRSQLSSQLSSQLDSQINRQLVTINSDWYNGTWWLSWSGWYDYGQYIGVDFDKKTFDLFMAYVENVEFIIPYKGVAFVSDKPKKVVWNNGLLSYDHGKAVEYADGWGLYSLDGVGFDEDEYNKIVNQEFTLETLAKAGMGADKSAVAIKYLKPGLLLKQVNAQLIDKGKHDGTELYQVDNFMNTGETEYCMKMEHPTIKGQYYIEWIEPSVAKNRNADLAQAVAFQITKRQYLSSINR